MCRGDDLLAIAEFQYFRKGFFSKQPTAATTVTVEPLQEKSQTRKEEEEEEEEEEEKEDQK